MICILTQLGKEWILITLMENKYLTFGLYVKVHIMFNLIQTAKNSINTINTNEFIEY